MRRNNRLRNIGGLALVAVVCFVTAGCGSSAPQTAAAPAPAGFAPKQEAKPTAPDLSGVDPNDVFEQVESPAANALIEPGAPALHPDQAFAAVLPTTRSDVVEADLASSAAAAPGSLPGGFTAVPGTRSVDGLPARIRCEADGLEMVLVPGGACVMGVENGPVECGPRVELQLSSFYISVTEVTVPPFLEFRKKARLKDPAFGEPLNASAGAGLPALGITWAEARAYCLASGRELPTEAQWEKAARGSAGAPAPWGASRPLWKEPRVPGQIDLVGRHPDDTSVFGAVDLAGNAREWVLDHYHADALRQMNSQPLSRRTDWPGPRGASPASHRTVKGDGPDWACWFRRSLHVTERQPQTGFRCVLNLSPTGGSQSRSD